MVNRLFALSFSDNFFVQPLENNLETYDNIKNFETGQGNGYKTGCLLDYSISTIIIK